ncbi:hypothetical protein HYH02_010223 [Chlamydomonas schloesseri]|uniref:Uncharacterized protein n=1 Tax=Chlamydomonas schloesseri TaxID=2026947 RepID=A0A835THV2_9CHLO|nr:hypothetical protein HYH02_010223 [Chlamydomonas schloesseri]|eukprot:KAG2440644.1 hypothetical protein HYH02_010223 [Chlamydomonas schloesseri]
MSRRGRTEGGSFTLIRRDRDMLQHEKMLLLANKRRLEALLRGVVDMQQLHPPPPAAPSLEGGSGGGLSHAPASTQRASSLRSSISGTLSGGGLSGVVMSRDGPSSAGAVPRSSPYGPSLRSQILRALDESSSLEWHMSPSGASSGPLFAGGNGGWADGNTEARVQELSARLVQLQTELDVTKTRYESELRYRNTQASAATTHLLKQVADLDTQVDELQRALIAAEGRVFDLTAQNTDLRHFNQELSATVRDKTVALEEAVALLGPDAAKLCEANEGLRSQLREANLALAARERRIHDLECQAASRSKSLLVHAHKAIDALRALAGISSAGAGVGGGFGQGGGAGGALAALTNLAMALGDPHEGHGSGGRSVKTDMCGGGWQPPLSPSRHDSWSPVTPTGDTYSAGGASDKS